MNLKFRTSITLVILIIFTMSKLNAQPSSKFYYADSDSIEFKVGKEIGLEELKEFLDKYDGSYNENYTNLLKADKAYFIELDVRNYIWIAVYKSGDIRLYNEDEFYIIVDHKKGHKPFSDEFIDEVPNLIKELAVKLDIDDISQSEEGLKVVSSAYKKIVNERTIVKKDFYLPLVAYIGEILKYRTNGEWRLINNYEYYELRIVDKKGIKYSPSGFLSEYFDRIGFDIEIEDVFYTELSFGDKF